MDVRRALLATLLLTLAPAARSEQVKPVDVKIGAVTLQIVQMDFGEQELRAGTRVLAKGEIITPGPAATFKDVPAMVFSVAPGGNACDGWPAVVTVDKAGKVALDSTMKDACALFDVTADEEGFTFVEKPVPDLEGSVWRFTPARGMSRLGVLVFRPQPNSTWNDLDKLLDHPISLFNCAPFDAAVHKLTGRQYADFAMRLRVAGEVEKHGDYLVATGCQAHACNSELGFVAIDRKAKAVFLAMRSEGKLTTWPKAAAWPAPLRAVLSDWEKVN